MVFSHPVRLKSLTFGRLNLPFFIAQRYLSGQKGAFSAIIRLSIFATGLSVAIMILSMAVVTGFQEKIKEKLYSFNGHVHVSSYDLTRSASLTVPPIYKDESLIASLRKIQHVSQVTPFVQRPVIVQSNGHMEGVQLKGVDQQYRFASSIELTGSRINYTDSVYAHEVLLSDGTARRLNVNAGDTVQLEFLNGGALPRIRRVRVCGLYHSGMEDIDRFFAICDIRLLQRLNNWTRDSINAYQLDLDNEIYADTIANYIHYNLINPPLESNTTAENYPSIFDWVNLQKLNGVILMVIMAIVSIINMAAVLVILMVDRAAMIGLLKALGMEFRSTVSVFLAIGGIIGGVGILFGNVIALTACWVQLRFGLLTLPEETYSMKYAPVKIVWWHVVAIDVTSLVLFVLCMWLPALYIRTIQPAKVLQFK